MSVHHLQIDVYVSNATIGECEDRRRDFPAHAAEFRRRCELTRAAMRTKPQEAGWSAIYTHTRSR